MNIYKVDELRDSNTLELQLGDLTFKRFEAKGKFIYLVPDTNITISIYFLYDTGGTVLTNFDDNWFFDFKYDENNNIDMDIVKDKVRECIKKMTSYKNLDKNHLKYEIELIDNLITQLSDTYRAVLL